MSNAQFRERIRESIANAALQTALDANAERRLKGRVAAFASLPDWQERRQRAHAMRAEVIAHLDTYLEDFQAKVTRNGIQVHRAANAAEAADLVLKIAEAGAGSAKHGAMLFAKSKSMVSEEIELNRALEKHGHRVVETDLGEYIVQLRGEKPSHIITPAVHLQRRQVGELFQQKLGLPYTVDIPVLTAAARQVLREVFLTADVGISGVNFGVAETGTLCIVTNEGNGRMVTTVPPLHIALMGMERLVPTLDDLALMLSLLPRSATGQKLSVYTQLIHSPRGDAEIDGPTERHLIIVDNGRGRLVDSPLQEALYCIRCGACLNACPVFREIGGHAYVGADGGLAPYPGPIGSVVSPGLLGLKNFAQLAQASSLCGACKDACPVDIDLPRLLTRVRAAPRKDAGKDSGNALSAASRIGLRAYAAVGASPPLFAASQRLAAMLSRVVSPASQWMRLPAFTRWGLSKDLPRPAWKPFRARWTSLGAANAAPIAGGDATAGADAAIAKPPAGDGQIERFIEELEALGGSVRLATASDLTQQLTALLHERAVGALLIWDEVEGVDARQLAVAGVRLVNDPDPSVKAGLTACTCAIAETGTVIVCSGSGQPLSASLLPEVHIAIVKSSQIVNSLEEALQAEEVRLASTAVLISGPSRTADIEMTLTIGVHGPKELIVYVVE